MFKTIARGGIVGLLGIALAGGAVGCRGPADPDVARTFRHGRYPGSRDREYLVHVPTGYDPAGRPVPLVLVLHGCHEDHRTIRHDTDFNRVADRVGFLVVYPFITGYPGFRSKNCWGFWLADQIHEGRGEVQDLAGIIAEVRRDYRVDPDRIHVAGVSSGAAMAVAALVAHSELIASGCATAGVPYAETPLAVSNNCFLPGAFRPVAAVAAAMDAEMGAEKRPVPLLVVHSTGDCVVKIRAAENLRDAWGLAFGVDTARPIAVESGVAKGTRWTRARYGAAPDATVIETLFLDGLPHGWYGGRAGDYAFANAPDTAQLAWEFFRDHPFRKP